ncbi:MAG: SMI1/KNR4 family protein [Lachnospiraceae bacterium]|nr:SMI1/KNR4 family protein [Lachnospiraceae bacterium]
MYDNRILCAHEKAKAEDLECIGQKFQVKIPAAVREHYLAYNGGYPEKPIFTGKSGNAYIVGWFIPVCSEKKRSVENMLKLLREDEAIPNWLIPFADEDGGNLFCFSVREEDYGAIYYYDHEFEYGEDPEDHVTYLTESITIFINSLVEEENDEDGEA